VGSSISFFSREKVSPSGFSKNTMKVWTLTIIVAGFLECAGAVVVVEKTADAYDFVG
jgi:hypothetical protein